MKNKIIGTPQNKIWDNFAEDYSNKIFSITKSPYKRQRILSHLTKNETILIAGAGSEVYLQKDIIKKMTPQNIIAGDFSEKMIEVSKKGFQHDNLKHEQIDTTNIPYQNHFNSVISTNSIIPVIRKQVEEMYTSIYNSLQPGGKFIAYLPSYNLIEEVLAKMPELKDAFKIDPVQSRFWDTNDWQCFHTNTLINKEFTLAGFSQIKIEKIGAEDNREKKELLKIYQIPDAVDLFWEYFVVAQKN